LAGEGSAAAKAFDEPRLSKLVALGFFVGVATDLVVA
jgi:hypothetical protein